jgi:prepilin signal peptidase PulO-like enzyme (type II secretory pathway)
LLVASGVTAAVVLSFARFGTVPRAFTAAFFAGVLVLLTSIDLERGVLPNVIVLPSAALVLAAQVLFFPEQALEWVIAAVAAGTFLLMPELIRPGAMGMGDVKLGLLLGAGLGYEVLAAIFLGSLVVLPVAIVLLVLPGRSVRGTTIPFGPCLALGALVLLYIG